MSEQHWSYIGRRPDGKVVCAAVDRQEWARQTRKDVSAWMKDGLTIERVPVEWVRRHLFTFEPYLPEDPEALRRGRIELGLEC